MGGRRERGQPRIVVFHEKKGRRHCHVIWLRLKPSTHSNRLIGVNMSHFKFKLMDISRGLFLKYGWKMPKGMEKGKGRGDGVSPGPSKKTFQLQQK